MTEICRRFSCEQAKSSESETPVRKPRWVRPISETVTYWSLIYPESEFGQITLHDVNR